MILATLLGIAVQTWADQPDAGLLGFLVGMVVAMFVPTKNSCSIR